MMLVPALSSGSGYLRHTSNTESPTIILGTNKMTFSPYIAIFVTVFLAELGDKTQLATVLFVSEGNHSPMSVFITASLALVASTAIAVLFGMFASKFANAIPIKLIAGLGFLFIGSLTVWEHFKA